MTRFLSLSFVLLAFVAVHAQTSTPQTIKVQGFLNQNGAPANGTFTMTFTLFDAQIPGGNVVTSVGPQSVPVGRGLYEVELALDASDFTGPDRYLEITVNGETLTPRMRMASAPFAYVADKLDGLEGVDFVKKAGDAMTGSLQVAGTINSTAGGFVFPDGTVQTTASTSGGAGNTLDQAYDQGGAGAGRTITADAGPVQIMGAGGVYVEGQPYPVDVITSNADDGFNVGMRVSRAIPGTTLLALGNYMRSASIRQGGTILTRESLNLVYNAWQQGFDFNIFNGTPENELDSATPAVSVKGESGWVGVGTSTPNAKLTVQGSISMMGSDPAASSGQVFLLAEINSFFPPSGAKGFVVTAAYPYSDGHAGHPFANVIRYDGNTVLGTDTNGSPLGNVGIGTTSPGAKLDIAGHTRTQVLEITGGSDVAEPFEITGAPPPGSAVIIDPEAPGSLRLSDRAYDKRVAGIVSGAGGIKPGLTLSRQETSGSGQHVALAGRVYAIADTSNGAIGPGDLLTTSSIPGHIMKATDYERAPGAVIGKAMSSLADHEGLVLVLVSLQ